MNFGRTRARSVPQTHEYDEGLRAYMLKVYNYMAGALGITGVVAYGVSTSETLISLFVTSGFHWLIFFATLGVVFYLSARIDRMSPEKAQAWFWGYAALMGLMLSSVFVVYTGASIARVFFITSAAFGGLSLYGYTTKKDLSGMGSFLIMGVWGLIIAMIVNYFLKSPALYYAVSALGVLIFAGLTAYDTQRIKESYYAFGGTTNTAIMGALSLYIDFINLFIFLLQFFGNRE